MPLLVDASSSPNLEAIKILQFAHGGDVGNYDACRSLRTRGFHHCLGGSTDAAGIAGVVLSPFGGLCVPDACGPLELGDPALRGGLALLARDANAPAAAGGFPPLGASSQVLV